MPKALTPRSRGNRRARSAHRSDLPRDVMDELQRVTKPTQLRDAVSRLSRAVDLLDRGGSGAAAAEAAGRSALSRAVPKLAGMLDDEEWWVRFRAGEALARLGAAGRLALHRAAIESAPAARAAAKATLAERGVA